MEATTLSVSRKRRASLVSSSSSDEERSAKKPRLENKMEEGSTSENLSGEEENQRASEIIEQPSLAPYLPPEILFKIFNSRYFDLSDLYKAGCVCASWNAFLKDEAFSWRILFKDRLLAHMPSGSADRFTVALEQIENKFLSNTRRKVHYSKWMMTLYEGNKRLEMSDLNDYSPQFLSDLLHSDVYAYELPNTRHVWRHTEEYHYDIHARINFYRLEMKIRRGEQVPIDMLTAVLLRNLKIGPYLGAFNIKDSYTPEVVQLVTEQPPDITGFQLHNYQIRAINWMVCTERESDKEYAVSPLLPIGRAHMYLYATSTSHQILYLEAPEQVRQYDLKFKAKGGILADEMGLGKTVEVIGLIASNPRTDFTPNTNKQRQYQTKATLIICPNHLVAQWKTEIEKYCGEKMTVLVITTIVQVKKYTSQDILDADIVLITYNLLSNKNYAKFQEGKEELRPLKGKGVILEQFHWHRLVCDEGHEHEELPRLRCSYRWYITGTPFPKADKLDKILVNNLLWRNTKASIKEEYELVKTKPHYVLLDFNPLEKIIYKDKCTAV